MEQPIGFMVVTKTGSGSGLTEKPEVIAMRVGDVVDVTCPNGWTRINLTSGGYITVQESIAEVCARLRDAGVNGLSRGSEGLR